MRGVNDNWNESVKCCAWRHGTRRVRWGSAASPRPAAKIMLAGPQVRQFREGDKLIDIVLRQPWTSATPLPISVALICPRPRASPSRSRKLPSPVHLGARCDVAREPRLRHHGAGDVTEGMQGATVTAALLPGLREIEARWHAAGQGGYRKWLRCRGGKLQGVCVDCGRRFRSCCSLPSRC